jgi:hypothetical protein
MTALPFLSQIHAIPMFDVLAKIQKLRNPVIPANPGPESGAPDASVFGYS